jgi:hypothetical protein
MLRRIDSGKMKRLGGRGESDSRMEVPTDVQKLIEQLLTESAAQKERFAALELENVAVKARVAELECRLGERS